MNNKELLEKVQAFLEQKEDDSSDYRNLLFSPGQRAIIAAREARKEKEEKEEKKKRLVSHYDPLEEQSSLPEPGTGGIGTFITQTKDRPKRQKSGMSDYDATQAALTAAGLAPGVGNLADLAAVGHSLYHGKWGDAGINAAAMIPIIGQLFGAGKLAKTGIKAADAAAGGAKAADAAAGGAKAADAAAGGAKALPPVRTDLPAPTPTTKPYQLADEPPSLADQINSIPAGWPEKLAQDEMEFLTREAGKAERFRVERPRHLAPETVPRPSLTAADDAALAAEKAAEKAAKETAEAEAKTAAKAKGPSLGKKVGKAALKTALKHPILTTAGTAATIVGVDAAYGERFPYIRNVYHWLMGDKEKQEVKESLHEHVRQTIKNNNLYS